jgi:hypothetical protein
MATMESISKDLILNGWKDKENLSNEKLVILSDHIFFGNLTSGICPRCKKVEEKALGIIPATKLCKKHSINILKTLMKKH